MAFFVRYGPVNRSLKLESESFESLLALIKKEFALANEAFHLSYFDEEHEKISVSCWNDFKVAVEEHSVMKKVVQLYIEQGDAEDAEDDDLVVINNSPNVTTKQVLAVAADAQSQTATVDRRDVPTQTAVAAKDEKNDEKQPAAINANGDTAAPPTGSFWARLFSSGAAAAGPTVAQPVNNEKSDSDILANDAAVLAPLSDRAECSSAAAEFDSQTARNISPTFSMLLLSDLGELLSHLRVETINQLDGANAEQFPSSSYGKLSFHRTKHMFEEELRTALADIRKHANNKNNAPVLLVDRPALKKVEEADDALAAIEKEEKKDEAVNESTVQSTPSVSYASVVAASVGAATSSSSAVLANPAVAAPAPAAQLGAVPSSSSSSPARSFATEKKSADWSSPAAFSMSDASVTQVLNMCQELGFKTDSTKVKYFMSKSNGDYAALIDWLMTDSLVKLNVPK